MKKIVSEAIDIGPLAFSKAHVTCGKQSRNFLIIVYTNRKVNRSYDTTVCTDHRCKMDTMVCDAKTMYFTIQIEKIHTVQLLEISKRCQQ